MTTIEKAKSEMRYAEKPINRMCSNCRYFSSEMITTNSFGKDWTEEKNMRCSVGKFKVKKTATCICHEFTDEILTK